MSVIGQSFGRYHILEQLGEGGMATVYKAYDTRLETDVAVKVIRTEALPQNAVDRALKRFEREAKALAKLTHANIVKVTDYGEHHGTPYLVMEYLPSGTLKELLHGKSMPWQEAVRLLIPVARALGYAHEEGMIHRDVKPSNILITRSGDPMLTDFGIAKIIDEDVTVDLTGTSSTVGTPEYMAPEQVTSKAVDKRADIYSLGVVLYEMVTGRKPFTADTPMAVLFKHASEPLPRPRNFVPGLPQPVENVLLKALAKKPEDRYQSMGELVKALESLSSAIPPPGQRRPAPRNEPASETKVTVNQVQSSVPAMLRPASIATAAKQAAPPWIWIVGIVLLVSLVATAGMLEHWLPTPFSKATKAPAITESLVATEARTVIAAQTASATETPTLGVGSTWVRPADGMTMMYVPEGNFSMGLPNGVGAASEHPQHTVYLDAFWIDRTEVTTGMYQLCVQAGACQPPVDKSSSTSSSYYGGTQYKDYPVITIDWNQANAYCGWAGSRLPTEAEWEKAARGTDSRAYPWGNDAPSCSVTNYNGNCVGDTSQVGIYPSGGSPYGVMDMAGNVWEWVADWYDANYYANSPSSNPQGPASGGSRVLRGGSWVSDAIKLRSSRRLSADPSTPSNDYGFRCAHSTPAASLGTASSSALAAPSSSSAGLGTPASEAAAGSLAGTWQDPSGRKYTFGVTNGGYEVLSILDPALGQATITSQEWANGKLSFNYEIISTSGSAYRWMETENLASEGLHVSYGDAAGYKLSPVEMILTRVPSP